MPQNARRRHRSQHKRAQPSRWAGQRPVASAAPSHATYSTTLGALCTRQSRPHLECVGDGGQNGHQARADALPHHRRALAVAAGNTPPLHASIECARAVELDDHRTVRSHVSPRVRSQPLPLRSAPSARQQQVCFEAPTPLTRSRRCGTAWSAGAGSCQGNGQGWLAERHGAIDSSHARAQHCRVRGMPTWQAEPARPGPYIGRTK